MVNWIKKPCPVCGRVFEYPEGVYAPKTCNNFDCVHSIHHHPEKYKTIMERLDECRIKAKI